MSGAPIARDEHWYKIPGTDACAELDVDPGRSPGPHGTFWRQGTCGADTLAKQVDEPLWKASLRKNHSPVVHPVDFEMKKPILSHTACTSVAPAHPVPVESNLAAFGAAAVAA